MLRERSDLTEYNAKQKLSRTTILKPNIFTNPKTLFHRGVISEQVISTGYCGDGPSPKLSGPSRISVEDAVLASEV
jgi:hypothetical protein